ncbi:hypothetical protein [Cryobacterium sp. M15]|uniref:hypothetical protein n=1 Tax=Cryobacterium sp. M15 TaxID=2048291 RepID=UPI0011B02CCC|nr:hypothetical protein [Cryobacterium sp. M15]
MLTKITLLLARHAEHAEWEFELRAMDGKSREGSSQGHAFLFIYTVARYYVAVTRAYAESNTSEAGSDRDESTFFGDFIDAVASNDPKRALTRWFSTEISAETDIAAPAIRQLAFEFLDRLTMPASDFIASDVADFLPDPYESDHSVG